MFLLSTYASKATAKTSSLAHTASTAQSFGFLPSSSRRAISTAHRMREGLRGEPTSGSIGGFGVGLELVGLGSWAAGVSASGLPMQVTAARSSAFGARTPW